MVLFCLLAGLFDCWLIYACVLSVYDLFCVLVVALVCFALIWFVCLLGFAVVRARWLCLGFAVVWLGLVCIWVCGLCLLIGFALLVVRLVECVLASCICWCLVVLYVCCVWFLVY